MVRKAATETASIEEITATNDPIYRDDEGKPLSLVSRLARVMGSIPTIDPEGTNKFFNYKFIKDKQVLGVVRPRLALQQILVVPETVVESEPIQMTTAKGGSSLMTRITVTWRIIDGLSGESFTGQSVGYGDDSGDKGANKAFTAALKNFLIKLFQIGGEPDIEEDEGTDKRAKARESASGTVEKVVISDAKIEGVERGGKAKGATDAQIARVGQYVRDLKMNPEAFAAFLMRSQNITLAFKNEDHWVDVRTLLEDMTGIQIGKVIEGLDQLYAAMDTEPTGVPE